MADDISNPKVAVGLMNEAVPIILRRIRSVIQQMKTQVAMKDGNACRAKVSELANYLFKPIEWGDMYADLKGFDHLLDSTIERMMKSSKMGKYCEIKRKGDNITVRFKSLRKKGLRGTRKVAIFPSGDVIIE